MAKTKDNPDTPTVTRVTAKDDRKAVEKPKSTPSNKKPTTISDEPKKQNILKRFFGYFKGSWLELKQVRWPSRRATWGMTAALLIFTTFFIALILVTDILWEYLFKLIFE